MRLWGIQSNLTAKGSRKSHITFSNASKGLGAPLVAGAQWRAMMPSGLHCKLVLDRRNVGECRQSGFIAKMLHLVRGSSLRKTQM